MPKKSRRSKIKVDAILFDLDGTLVDSSGDITASVNYMLGRIGRRPLSKRFIMGQIGNGARALLTNCLGVVDDKLFDEAMAIFTPYYFRNCLRRTGMYPGALGMLEKFRGKKMAVVTNKPQLPTEKILRGLKIGKYFSVVLGPERCSKRKPAPEPFLEALDAMHLPRPCGRPRGGVRSYLVVGDSDVDVIAGRAAGCITCGIAGGLGDTRILRRSKPDMLIKSIKELPDYFC